jgi:hypothetical protein
MTEKLTVAEEIRLAATGEMEARRLLGKPARAFAEIVNEAVAPSRLVAFKELSPERRQSPLLIF